MKTKKINLEGLKNVLSPKEMKNVKGGSCDVCSTSCSGAPCYVIDFGTSYFVAYECCF